MPKFISRKTTIQQAIRIGWLFFLLIGLALPGCRPRNVAPQIQYDQEHVDEVRQQIDQGDWE